MLDIFLVYLQGYNLCYINEIDTVKSHKMSLKQLFILVILVSKSWGNPVVETSDGQLKGMTFKDYDGNDFFSFQSVPYAKPPIGDERFKDSKPVEKWSGVRDATEDLPNCFQKQDKGVYLGVEDCLYLNVHTPEIIPKKLRPVMVFIHGGGFTEGSGRHDLYGPEYLMTADVVLVTINYRLGFFGFLNFEDPSVDVPGNAGLKDQLLALKWVKRNIARFGGDPDNVTIFGESAGAASVHFHVISPASQGYFQKAIAMSGVALAASCNGMENNGVVLARKLGYEGEDQAEMLRLLQSIDLDQAKEILDDTAPLIVPMLHETNYFGPTLDNIFITDSITNLIKKGNFNKVPFMIGYTDQDGMVMDVLYWWRRGKYDHWPLDRYIPKWFNLTDTDKQTLFDEITSFYFKNGRTIQADIDLNSDPYLMWPMYETIFAHMKQGQDVFFYGFFSDTKVNRFKLLNPITAKYKGACHMDELGYLFTSSFTDVAVKGSIEDKSIRVMVNLLANFAKDGNPTRDGFDIEWKKTDADSLNCFEIENDAVRIGYAPEKERVQFWVNVSKKYNSRMETNIEW